ncbi:MAG: BTAD domain-containing putative transcriptional regulator [Caldilineaceae bacterium]
MSKLSLTCFHALQITLDDQEVAFRSAKGRALLIYLAVEQARTHQRSMVAGLLWPDLPEARARQNLSQTLLEVRKAIGDQAAKPPFLQITSQTIAFNRQSDHWLDVAAFTHALAATDYVQAADLYRGAFLADFSLPDSDLWEEWAERLRESYRQQALDLFLKLSERYEQQGKLDDALATTRKLLALAPWQEEAHRQLMWLLALAGQRSAALAQYDTLTQILLDEWGVAPAAETDALYDRIVAGHVTPRPFTVSTAASPVVMQPAKLEAPFQAIAPPVHFVGRRQEIDRLRAGLTAPGLQIRAIVGMGGVGKTTLAAQIAHAKRADFRDGVLWGNPLTSNALDILAAWASAYGYDFGQINDLSSRAAAVRGILAERHTLLIIDNVRQVSDIEPLLPSGGECAVLFTTRDLEVATALNAEVLLLDELEENDALELLRKILGDQRVEQEYMAAVELCTLCGELPLAVEIAAQRLKSRPRMKLAQMVARLGDVTHRLDLGISDRAVRASFAVSWAALDEGLQQLFPLLAVFEGRSFTVNAVAYLAALSVIDVEDYLFSLSALSLVREEGEDRYGQHPLLADFAREKLTDTAQAFCRCSDYYHMYVQEHAEDYTQLRPEWGNITAAIGLAYAQQRWQLVLDYTNLLAQTWLRQARYSEARRVYAWANQAAQMLGDELALATNLTRWSVVTIEQNSYAEAKQQLTTALQHWMNLEEDYGVADARFHLARIAIEQGNYTEAEELLHSSLELRKLHGDIQGAALVQYRQAGMHFLHNDLEKAEALLQEALAQQEKVQAYYEMIPTLRLLAQIAAARKLFTAANSFCERARELCQEFQDEGELAAIYHTMAIIQRRQQNFEKAYEYTEQALPLFQRLGLQRSEGMAYYQRSTILFALHKYHDALSCNLKSIEIFDSIQNTLGKLYSLVLLGDLYKTLEEPQKSLIAWQEAQEIAELLNHQNVLNQLQERRNTY